MPLFTPHSISWLNFHFLCCFSASTSLILSSFIDVIQSKREEHLHILYIGKVYSPLNYYFILKHTSTNFSLFLKKKQNSYYILKSKRNYKHRTEQKPKKRKKETTTLQIIDRCKLIKLLIKNCFGFTLPILPNDFFFWPNNYCYKIY